MLRIDTRKHISSVASGRTYPRRHPYSKMLKTLVSLDFGLVLQPSLYSRNAPELIRLPQASNKFSPFVWYATPLDYCYNRFSRVTSASSTFGHVNNYTKITMRSIDPDWKSTFRFDFPLSLPTPQAERGDSRESVENDA
jgi:hypothetical protein